MPILTRRRSNLGREVSAKPKLGANRSVLSNIQNVQGNGGNQGLKKKNTFEIQEKPKVLEGGLVYLQSKFGVNDECPIDEIDETEVNLPRYAAEYISDVLSHYKSLQGSLDYRIDPDYMLKQKDINSKMRELLVDWLSQVHTKFKLNAPTFYLGISLLDRFLSGTQIKRDKLQLVGCCTLWLAAKYEEIYAPEIDDFVLISDNSFEYDDMIKAEKYILESLKYKLCGPTVYVFVRRFIKVLGCSVRLQYLIGYLLEFLQQRIEVLKFKTDLVAASVVWFAVCVERMNLTENKENINSEAMQVTCDDELEYEWDESIVRISGYEEKDLYECMNVVKELVLGNKKSSNRAVARKYSSDSFLQVSTFDFDVFFEDFEDHEMDES